MKLKLILLCSILFFINGKTFATHAKGGRIEARQIGGLTFEITIITYTKTSSTQADRPQLDSVHMGDGTLPIIFIRQSFTDLPDDVRLNIYQNTHTYASSGTFKISFSDPNRTIGITNIPNSVQIPFHVETEIVVNNTNCLYTSPSQFSLPIFESPNGKNLIMSRAAYDMNWDILSYELDTCMGGNGNIPGYTIPSGVSVDPYTGELVWVADTSMQPGLYCFAIRIDKWRNGLRNGYMMEDFMIEIEALNNNFDFNYNLYSSNLTSHILPGDTLIVPVEYFNTTGPVRLIYYSQLQSVSTFQFINPTPDSAKGTLTWIPSVYDARLTPYHLVFRGSPGLKDLTYEVYVDGATADSCHNLISVNEIPGEYDISIYPIPAYEKFHIDLNENLIEKIQLYDCTGRIIYSAKHLNEIDVSNISTGIYLLHLKSGNNLFTRKITIVRP